MGGWSNDQPNPLEVGGGGDSGSIIVYNGAGEILATLDENGLTFYDPDDAGKAIEFNPFPLPGHTVEPGSVASATDTSGFTDAVDFVITGPALDGGVPASISLGDGGGVIATGHIDIYAQGSIHVTADDAWDIFLDAIDGRVFVGGDVITGTLIGCTGTSVSAQATTAGNDTNTSATFANMAGTGSVTSLSFFKRYDDSKIKLSMAGTVATNNTASQLELALRINGVDYVVGRIYGTVPANTRIPFSFFAEVGYGVVPAGTYTVQARWRNVNATGTWARDTLDWLCIDAEERG